MVQTNRELHTDANLDLLLNSPGASPVSPHSSAFRVQTSPTTPSKADGLPPKRDEELQGGAKLIGCELLSRFLSVTRRFTLH